MLGNEIADTAFQRAWRVYHMLNKSEGQHTKRCPELKKFISRCCEHGATDSETIVVLALIHLKQLDEMELRETKRSGRCASGKNGTNDPASD